MSRFFHSLALTALLACLATPTFAKAPDPHSSAAPPSETVSLDAVLNGDIGSQPATRLQDVAPHKDCLADEHSPEKMRAYMDAKITNLHNQIGITPAQEKLWSKVAATMRHNEESMMKGMKHKHKKHHEMSEPHTALDILDHGEKFSTLHVEHLLHFRAAFAPLYKALTAEQKANADKAIAEMFTPPHHPMMMGQ